MKYKNVITGKFKSRPNRFIAMVEIDGKIEKCHVKNTGRCKELLLSDAEVYLEKGDNPNRKTAYDLVGVKKGERMINMDSQAPNKAVKEWLEKEVYFKHITYLKPECKYGNSRIDFYLETAEGRKIFIEVKGVTLEENGIARFPDAPTERGIKHIQELQEAVTDGYEAYILFVIQMKEILHFEPNDRTHKAFGDALREAAEHGVGVLAYECVVTRESMCLDEAVRVYL
ncbi:DNA/RNA nuclease SfsA [Roseburia sp. 499]|uniref:DNA/RNA nuclease SfsA n=1 Tax=Roseburia sp. 499 TaxID=1261634 RepID=UPI0009526A0C|nr:DNA/RNA nuclease SfsA [Roseburia sp. 499]WVK70613.1 DNA/RNA nuclease SfsA [Roseburia sp. 499]